MRSLAPTAFRPGTPAGAGQVIRPPAGRRLRALLAWLLAGVAGGVLAAEIELGPIAKKDATVAVVLSTNSPLVVKTARWCRDFLTQHGYRAEVVSSVKDAGANGSMWVLEIERHCPTARGLGAEVGPLSATRGDAYYRSVSDRGGQPVVVIVGKDEVGLRSGVARLVGEAVEESQRLLAPRGAAVRSPFFPVRELVVANRGTVLQNTPYADTLWRRWSDERIRAYAEQLWLFGFNSIQLGEARSFAITPESEPRALEVAGKLRVLSDAAHENGLRVSQLVWGQAPFNKKICWNTPASRAVMEKEFRWMAAAYAPHVDHVVLHMRDPGGCNCGVCDDYKTPQQIAALVLQTYRQVNPAITLTLSTWFNQTFWAYAPGVRFLSDTSVQYWVGDPDVPFRDREAARVLPGAPATRFLDETFCPREIGIALHKWYNADKAARVLDSGRAADIWGWYLSDQETTADMSLCMRRVDYYFSALPAGASADIRRISTELCFHGWPQVINAYVSAQKMWSPRRDLKDIEREFCAGTFGEANADAMVALYEACELAVNPKRGDTCLPSLDAVLGNPRYQGRFRAGLAAGRRVVLDPAYRPRLSSATPPAALLEYLLRHLTLIDLFSDAQAKLKAALKAGAGRSELDALIAQTERQAQPFSSELLYPALLTQLKDSARPGGK